jgi:hypothetical protein
VTLVIEAPTFENSMTRRSVSLTIGGSSAAAVPPFAAGVVGGGVGVVRSGVDVLATSAGVLPLAGAG